MVSLAFSIVDMQFIIVLSLSITYEFDLYGLVCEQRSLFCAVSLPNVSPTDQFDTNSMSVDTQTGHFIEIKCDRNLELDNRSKRYL